MQIRSKAVVISTGGKPSIPRDIFNYVSKEKLITSDFFLRKKGYESFMGTLMKNTTKRKIVIIGGSHSGFSCAWMLLNGPVSYNYNKNGKKFTFDKPPGASLYKCKNEYDWGNYIPESYTKSGSSNSKKEWHWFGWFEQDEIWKFEKPKNFPKFAEGQITILYRDRIKVFYSKVSYAIADGYTDYKSQCFRNKNGYLYSFTGLRGDARKLYKNISSHKEIKISRAETWAEQQKYIDAADYVILAWGFQTNKIPIKTTDGKDIKLGARNPGTQFDIDNRFRLKMQDGGVIGKVFGSGLAFPTRTNDGRIVPEVGHPNPRADSFSLYLNYVGTKVLDSLLPKSKLSNKVLYVYNDKVLKKKRADEEELRKRIQIMDKLATQSSHKNVKARVYDPPKSRKIMSRSNENRAARKIVRKSNIVKQHINTNTLNSMDCKTPEKKSFPEKIRDQVNSCKKTDTGNIISTNPDLGMQNINKTKHLNHISKSKYLKDHVKVPVSYYSSEKVTQNIINVQNSSYYNKSMLKNTIKPGPTAVEALVSPQKGISSKINSLSNPKYPKHSTRQSLQYAEYQQINEKNGYSENMHHWLNLQKCLDSGNKNRSYLCNNGKNVMSAMNSQGINEYDDKEVDIE